ncbi:hypothetical protein [Methylobacterium sp. J-068]|uniref:hypothetical protein n=1 Tax=Methylobacterium sp. J-068 TaxID=2836649 RepID=UPI001FBB33C0|nr:hypothetical protein [Methylobacterium sp. J-068]MCJ2036546.1 hypothetical protein [Methylobacterium sp. J-068]
MNIAATLTLQSLPFAGIVLATSKNKDLFLLVYLSCVGLILTLVVLFGDTLVDRASFEAMIEGLATN